MANACPSACSAAAPVVYGQVLLVGRCDAAAPGFLTMVDPTAPSPLSIHGSSPVVVNRAGTGVQGLVLVARNASTQAPDRTQSGKSVLYGDFFYAQLNGQYSGGATYFLRFDPGNAGDLIDYFWEPLNVTASYWFSLAPAPGNASMTGQPVRQGDLVYLRTNPSATYSGGNAYCNATTPSGSPPECATPSGCRLNWTCPGQAQNIHYVSIAPAPTATNLSNANPSPNPGAVELAYAGSPANSVLSVFGAQQQPNLLYAPAVFGCTAPGPTPLPSPCSNTPCPGTVCPCAVGLNPYCAVQNYQAVWGCAGTPTPPGPIVPFTPSTSGASAPGSSLRLWLIVLGVVVAAALVAAIVVWASRRSRAKAA